AQASPLSLHAALPIWLRRKTESAFSSMVREDVLLGGGSTQDEGAADPTFAPAEAAAVRVEHIVGDLEAPADADPEPVAAPAPDADRKSTRLNSSHEKI